MGLDNLSGTAALVTGASRGFGRAITGALVGAGAEVVGVARDSTRLLEMHALLGESFTAVTADAADPLIAGQLIDQYQPRILILNAGATALPRPIQRHTWETFSRNWEVDVRHTFHWIREALLAPLDAGSVVIALSSGAAIGGSPLSGGYAGAKSTIRFITSYARDEAERDDLGIRFVSALPGLTPGTGVGAAGIAGYAKRQGTDVATFIDRVGPTLTPDEVGKVVVEIAADSGFDQPAYLLTPAGVTLAP